ncbi:MAG: hypothetical protein NTX59_02415 [Elusimicrobia bacterium]|nr:hypothetical protein [Elusimicrobiota bacterium]
MTINDTDTNRASATPEPPSKWWGYPGVALAVWIIYRVTEPWQEVHWGMSKEQAFILAFVVLMIAWHSFLYNLFLVYCVIVQAGEEEDRSRKKIAALPLAEAKAKALELLKDPMKFQCIPAKTPPERELPPSVRELFLVYELIEARDYPKDVRLDQKEMLASRAAAGFLSIGGYFDEEVAIRPGEDTVYEIDCAQTGKERKQKTFPSIFHWIVLTAERQDQSREDAVFNGDTSKP